MHTRREYTYLYEYMYISMSTCTYMNTYTYMNTCTYINTRMNMYEYMFEYMYMYECMYIYEYGAGNGCVSIRCILHTSTYTYSCTSCTWSHTHTSCTSYMHVHGHTHITSTLLHVIFLARLLGPAEPSSHETIPSASECSRPSRPCAATDHHAREALPPTIKPNLTLLRR